VEIAVVVFTGALVLATAVYAYFTWRMAAEMRETRLQSVRPRLALYVRPYGPAGGHLALVSLGPGAALDVAVSLGFEPSGETREWSASVFQPGQEAEFFFPHTEPGKLPGFDELERHDVSASVNGTMRDVVGRPYPVSEHIEVGAWSRLLTTAEQHYVEPPPEEVARELKKIRETLEKRNASS
jgi:hypothetical protein